MSELSGSGALELAGALRGGELTAEDLARAYLNRIDEGEPEIHAFAHFDPELVLSQARAADEHRRSGGALGALHGVPVGVKDIFDTHDMPTESGSAAYAGRRPEADSAVVERLRAAGAVILGKTVTTELASFSPGPTRNPHDPGRTPGGSSSGSAAAVAAGMAPLAIGSQTAGSTIRPGSFCGVIAFKPQFGAISRHRCTVLSPTLDHVGLYARSVADIALLGSVLCGPDARDPDAGAVDAATLAAYSFDSSRPAPRLAFVPTPFWARADSDTRAGFESLAGRADLNCRRIDLPARFEHALDWLNAICQLEMALEHDDLLQVHRELLQPQTREELETCRRVTANEYLEGKRGQVELRLLLDEALGDIDAIITPAALGEAPIGLESTGDPVFCSTWTLVGHPAITLPLLHGANGLPIGVQLVGRRGGDAALLGVADWLQRCVDAR